MENKNHFIVSGFLQLAGKEYFILEYIPDPNDPKHDDFPSERYGKGKHYYGKFTEVNPEPTPDFNKK